MFVDQLSTAEKDILVRLLCEVSQADQLVSIDEREVITRYALSLGTPLERIEAAIHHPEPVDDDTLRALPESSRRVILIEAQTLAMIDSVYGDVERAQVTTLAARLALEPHVQLQINDYVQRGFDWAREGAQIVGSA